MNYIKECVAEECESNWIITLLDDTPRRNGSGNKLRLFRLFKNSFNISGYVKNPLPLKHHHTLAKIRYGVALLHIETGQYEQLPLQERLCQLCDSNAIEHEPHFLFNCDFLTNECVTLVNAASELNMNLNNQDKLV